MVTPGDLQNTRKPDEQCPACQNAGRVGDAVCPRACDASTPYYAETGPDPECARLAFEWSTALA